MNKLLAMVFVLASLGIASAQEAAPSPSPSYTDVIRTCGAEWRERTDKATNKGRDAWNTFRAECVTRKGFVSKRNAVKKDFVRVPDKQ